MRLHPKKFNMERIDKLNTHVYLATAVASGNADGLESILLAPTQLEVFALACEVYGDHIRMDLAQDVVVMRPSAYRALIEHAGLSSVPYVQGTPIDSPPRLKPIPHVGRRRRQIFNESQGKCHYCSCELQLDGKWHVEHKFPRALGGGDEPTNLVASCVPCNSKKRDTTDQEFKARLAKESA